jgi:hypothetical protein
VTKHAGTTWIDVTANTTKAGGPDDAWVTRVFASNINAGTAYVTKSRLRQDDFRLFVFKTTDYGATWTSIIGNLPNRSVNVIFEDYKNSDLLFVGNDAGVYVTNDGGALVRVERKYHIVQIVNSRMAVFTKKGKRFDSTGKVLYGPVVTNAVFAGFGGQCEARNNGDAVVRYDQLAHRWLIVMPIFARGPVRPDQPPVWKSGEPAQLSPAGRPNQPGAPFKLVPPPVPNPTINPNRAAPATQGQGPFSICYAVSTSEDPLGEYYRYEFLRSLFPDYPRPAVWPDGYYVPTSTGDDVIQKHACVVERDKMLKGLPATEQCIIVDGVNFLNNADLDGFALPPRGAPNIVIAAGGTQLKKILEDDCVYAWNFHVDWGKSTRVTTALSGT